MNIGITGGTGFMGSHLARRLVDEGHEVVLVSRGSGGRTSEVRELADTRFVAASVGERAALREAFADCDGVAHLAGINLERGEQTYETVHVEGTRNAVAAAEAADASKVILSSFLRARPDCGSGYHESKWAAEEIVRQSELDHTILKAGVTYGRGDHMLEHISRSLLTVPVFPLIGFEERRLRPLAIDDLVDIMVASLTDGRLSATTVAVVGPEELALKEAIQRIGGVLAREPYMFRLPVRVHYGLAWLQERIMETPITAVAQVRILAEGVTEPAPQAVCDPLPEELEPTRRFSTEQIEQGLSHPRRYGIEDLRL